MSERVAVISDAHSDRIALTAVLVDIRARGIKRVWSLGDLVDGRGGTEGAACLADAREACEIMLAGNHEFFLARQLLAPPDDAPSHLARAQAAGFSRETIRFMEGLPSRRLVAELGADLVHGAPGTARDERVSFIRTPAAAKRALTLARAPLLLFGHTHAPRSYTMPADDSGEAISVGARLGKTIDLPERCALNPGAVNDPRGARWLELGFSVDGRRTATPRRAAMAGCGASLRRPRANPPRPY